MKKTVTSAVLQANRQNAKSSTGPRLVDAIKYNAVKHGLLSKALFFTNDEEKAAYELLADEMEQDLQPQGRAEIMLVEEATVAHWKLLIVQRLMMQQFTTSQKASADFCEQIINRADGTIEPGKLGNAPPRSLIQFPWECQSLLLTTDAKKYARYKLQGPSSYTRIVDSDSQVSFAAKMGSSMENLLRYEIVWRRDLYRALAALKTLQSKRENMD